MTPAYPMIIPSAGFLIAMLPIILISILVVVLVVKMINSRSSSIGTERAETSASRAERSSLLRQRRDRYQQERARILAMVDSGQISASEGARLLDSVERETTIMSCPFCGQDTRFEALKCRHCGNYLVEEDRRPKRLARSNDRMLAGVCGGLADYTGLDVSLIRILVVLATLSTGIFYGLLIYLVTAIVMPPAESA